MKHRLVIIVMMLMTTAMVMAGNSHDNKAVMCVDTVEVEVDTIYTDNPYLSFEIEYWNGGKGKLTIDSVLTSCHCTKVKYEKVALSHNERSCLKVDVDKSMAATGHYYNEIYVYYNGRREPLELLFVGFLLRRENNL